MGFEFQYRAYGLLLLLLVPLFMALIYHVKKIQSGKDFLGRSLILPGNLARLIRYFAPLAIFTLAVIALMGPRGNPHYSELEVHKKEKIALQSRSKANIVLMLDTSSSMLVTDTSTKETRLSAAKELAEEVVGRALPSNTVFYAVGSELVKVVPRTLDKVFVRFMIKETEVKEAGSGTDFLAAAESLAKDLQAIPDPVAILFLTDGDDTALEGASPDRIHTQAEKILQVLKKDLNRFIPLYIVAFGTSQGGEVPDVLYKGRPVVSKRGDLLIKTLAEGSGGKYWNFEAENKGDLTETLVKILSKTPYALTEGVLKDPRESLLWDDYYQIPLFMALTLLLLYLTFPDTLNKLGYRGGAMMLLLVSSPSLERNIEILYEAGAEIQLEEEVENAAANSQGGWLKGALLFDSASLKIEQKDYKGAREALEEIHFSENTSPYVLSKVSELKAYISLIESEESSKEINQVYLEKLFTLFFLRDAENAACRFQKIKGYENCTPSYSIAELKKRAKFLLNSPEKDSSSMSSVMLAAFGLEWLDRLKLTEENPAYYEVFKSTLQGDSPYAYKDAILNFIQKDFSESRTFFEREVEKQVQLSKELPLQQKIETLLSELSLTPYAIVALDDKESLAAKEKIEQGEPIWARLLLMNRLQQLKREAFLLKGLKDPVSLLKWSIEEQKFAILMAVFAKEIKTFNDQALLVNSQIAAEASLVPFIPESLKWRKAQFIEKGCEVIPWVEIIPLYEKGTTEQAAGHEALKDNKILSALPHQNMALASLEEALKLFEKPPSSAQSPQNKESLSDTLRLFQDLELSDKALQIPTAAPPPEEKPW